MFACLLGSSGLAGSSSPGCGRAPTALGVCEHAMQPVSASQSLSQHVTVAYLFILMVAYLISTFLMTDGDLTEALYVEHLL